MTPTAINLIATGGTLCALTAAWKWWRIARTWEATAGRWQEIAEEWQQQAKCWQATSEYWRSHTVRRET